jgi:hypothetical protein
MRALAHPARRSRSLEYRQNHRAYSMPTKLVSGRDLAASTRNVPLPMPISISTGWELPNISDHTMGRGNVSTSRPTGSTIRARCVCISGEGIAGKLRGKHFRAGDGGGKIAPQEKTTMSDKALLHLANDVRGKTLKLLDGVSDAQARYAPPGLNNTILWHAGHAVVVNEHLGMSAATGSRRSIRRAGSTSSVGRASRPR